MIDSIENIVRKIILKKYPLLTDVSIEDMYGDSSLTSMLGSSFICKFKSDECLSEKEHMTIDTEVKTLFEMLSPESSGFRKPDILCFFDCGEGYEFKMSYGYKH
jgi:hypothetical protein